jgi:hypothetical protein
MSIAQKEFIVTVRDYDLLEEFYNEMESADATAVHLPKRSVSCTLRRPVSRNTHYLLTDDEARELAKDPRVEAVTVKVKGLGIKTNLHADQLGNWDRGTGIAIGQNNYGLYRISLEDNISGWGSEGDGSEQTATLRISSSGKNVDVIVVDETAYPNHPEFDDRLVQYDWYNQLDEFVKGTGVLISTIERTNNSAIVTMQAPHGLKVDEVINITCSSDSSFSSVSAVITDVPSPTTIEYSNAGLDVVSTSATGFWRGVYQYNDYSGSNNHATHVAAIIGGETQGWARDVNLYNLKHNANPSLYDNFSYPDSDLLFDYIREFHARKDVNPATGRKNPTLVNNSWGFGTDVSATNMHTGYTFPSISNLYYRGGFVTAEGDAGDTGISGVYASTELLDQLTVAPGSGNRITTAEGNITSVTSTTFENTNRVGLSNLGAPTISNADGVDDYDDAYWTVTLPFGISYLGTTYNTVTVVSNSFVTFGGASTAFFLGAAAPAIRKIFVSAGDRSSDAVYGGVTGTTGSRIYTIRWEGYDGAYGNLTGDGVNMIWEMKFYEAIPEQIDLHVVTNASYRAEFTREELASYGLNMSGPVAPYRNAAMDADIQDAIDDGIIFVGSAGNSATKIDVNEGLDYDNYFIDNGLPVYYHRGTSPGASANVICVGEASSSSTETKSQISNSGPRVDLYAPGQNIISAVYNGATNINPVVNDGSATASLTIGSSVASGDSAVVTVSTTLPHNFTNGDIITIPDCSTSFFNSDRVAITVINPTTFSYPIPINSSTGFAAITGTSSGGFIVSDDTATVDINMAVVFTEQTGSLTLNGSPINSATVYYVRSINPLTNVITLGLAQDGISLTAAGTGTATIRNKITGTAYKGFLYQKYSGTSMAAAQVTGLLALALEKYPNMTQEDARNYIISYAKNNKLTASTGGYNDSTSLQGGENKFAFYYKERPDTGITVPKFKEWLRPSAGLVFPRQIIRKK